MKERRKGLLWEMALILLTVAACLYSTGAGNIFGAKVDWSSQHSVFPEYFRQQFYRIKYWRWSEYLQFFLLWIV